jgi:ketosteroid isomerase-like protein
MSRIPHFARYAAAFEKAYANDDWSLVEPFFTEDAVYEVGLGPPLGGRFEGRAAILAYFKRALDDFDRRFASREVALREGPRERDGSVWIRGSARYTGKGVPDLEFELEETATFEGDRIRRLEDRYTEATARALEDYVHEHGPKLGIPGA